MLARAGVLTACRSSRPFDTTPVLAAAFKRHSTGWGTRAFSTTPGSSTLDSSTTETASHGAYELARELFSSTEQFQGLYGFAAQPLEPMAQFLNPLVIGSSVWELAHTATGLPWWASIPLTTFAIRTGLLYFTIKAKSAALNWVLLQNAFQTASNLLRQMQQHAASGPPSLTGDKQQLKTPSRFKLARMYYKYFRKQHRTTSMWWWAGNAFLQVNLFVVMSVALRQMAYLQWPGFTTEGLWWLTDLSKPAVLWGSWTCPYGVAGALLPLSMLMLYKATIDSSPAVRTQGVKLLLECFCLPYFVACCVVPQATLLYWTGNSLFFYGLQSALQDKRLARWVGLPTMLLPTPKGPEDEKERLEQEAADARHLICGSEDDGFLRYLAASYLTRGLHQQALQCLQRLTVLAPGDSAAFSALGRTAAELQQWPVAAAAFGRAAELHRATGEVDEQAAELVLSAKHWLNAVAEARQASKSSAKASSSKKHAAGAAGSQTAVEGSSSSSSSIGGGSSDEVASTPSKQQMYIDLALAALQDAVRLPAEAAAEGWYLLAMAHAAAGQTNEGLAAAQTYWAHACEKAESDSTAKSNATAKLLPVLANLCNQYHKQHDNEQLLSTASMAVEVAQCGWDRQSKEKLHDTLGVAAQAASQNGKFAYAEQLKQLQQKLVGSTGLYKKKGAS